MQVSFCVRSPTIACTPSEVSCTGKGSVICWRMSTSSWGEQSYATRSLLTAWLYTLVHADEFNQFKNHYIYIVPHDFIGMRWIRLQTLYRFGLYLFILSSQLVCRIARYMSKRLMYNMISEIQLCPIVLFPGHLSSIHLLLWPSLLSMTNFIMQNALYC